MVTLISDALSDDRFWWEFARTSIKGGVACFRNSWLRLGIACHIAGLCRSLSVGGFNGWTHLALLHEQPPRPNRSGPGAPRRRTMPNIPVHGHPAVAAAGISVAARNNERPDAQSLRAATHNEGRKGSTLAGRGTDDSGSQ